MKNIIGAVIIILSWVLALYVGLWEMFIKPIIDSCIAFDNGTLTGVMVGITVLKCIFASGVAGAILWIGNRIGLILLNSKK